MIALLRSLHAWAGAVLAMLLIVIGASGTVVLLRGEIVRLTVPAARAPAPPATTYGRALSQAESETGRAIRAVKFSPYGLGVHRVGFEDGVAAFIDARGGVVERWRGQARFEDWMLNLHHALLLRAPGERAAGVAALGGVALVLSGFAVWLFPRPRVRFRVWPAGGARRDVLAAHRALGSLAAVFVLAQLVTGAGMALSEFARPLMGAQKPAPPSVASIGGKAAWPQVLAAAQAAYPDAAVRRAFAPRAPEAPYVIHLQQPGDLNPEGGTIVFADGAGRVAGIYDEAAVPASARLYNAFLGLHAGDYAAGGGRLVAGATGLALVMLGALGLWGFIRRPWGRASGAA